MAGLLYTPRILLIRHGSTDFNSTGAGDKDERLRGWLDVPLNNDGHKEAARVASELSDEPVSQIYTSNLQRAYDVADAIKTANPSAQQPKMAQQLRPWNVGRWSGKRVSGILDDMIKLQTTHKDEPAPGGESFNDFLRRFLPFMAGHMNKAAESHDGELPVMVSHTRNLRAMDGWLKAGANGIDVDDKAMSGGEHLQPGEGLELSYHGGKWNSKPILTQKPANGGALKDYLKP